MGAPLLINRMVKQGSERSNLILKIAGGAKMFAIPGNSQLDIGQKNIAEIKATLNRENVPLCGADVGGTLGRTVHLYVDTGKVEIKLANGRVNNL
jgi:chemotaxis protein CheD